jgi:spermidine synthase
MLATLLVGIAVGSRVISRVGSRIKGGFTLLGVLFVLVGFAAIATLPLFSELTLWKRDYLASLAENATLDTPPPWGRFVMFNFLIASLIMLGPTLLMGAAFPLAVRLYSSTVDHVGRKIGVVYASNTVGGIVGAVVAGFVLIPFLGLRDALIAICSVSVATGVVVFLFQATVPRRHRIVRVAVPVIAFAIVVSMLPRNTYQRIFQLAQKDFELVYYKEDPTATVTAHKRGERVIININGLNVAGTGFNFLTTQKMQAHLGMLLHPEPKRLLQIGFGSGGTCYSVSLHKSVERIDCVELCQGVIEAASHFLPSNHDVLQNPKVHLTIEDARNYILAMPDRYDLILSDSIHPTYAGNGTLYSQDYFKLCREKLNPGGYVSFWLPMYLLSTRDYKTIVKTFQSVFPNVTIWYVNNAIEAYSIVLGRMEPFEIDVGRLREKLQDPDIARDLGSIDIHSELDILSFFVMGPEAVARYVEDGDINSDDHPLIEFRAPKSMTREGTWYQNLRGLAEHREMPTDLLTDPGGRDEAARLTDRLGRLYPAIGVLIQGQLVNIVTTDFDREYARYLEAEKMYPGNLAIERLKRLAESRVSVLRGEELVRSGRATEAIEYYRQAIAVNPDPYDDSVGHAYFRLGQIYERLHEPAKAWADYKQCLDIFPTHIGSLLASASLAIRGGRTQEARSLVGRLETLYPGDDRVRSLRKSLGSR